MAIVLHPPLLLVPHRHPDPHTHTPLSRGGGSPRPVLRAPPSGPHGPSLPGTYPQAPTEPCEFSFIQMHPLSGCYGPGWRPAVSKRPGPRAALPDGENPTEKALSEDTACLRAVTPVGNTPPFCIFISFAANYFLCEGRVQASPPKPNTEKPREGKHRLPLLTSLQLSVSSKSPVFRQRSLRLFITPSLLDPSPPRSS